MPTATDATSNDAPATIGSRLIAAVLRVIMILSGHRLTPIELRASSVTIG